MLDEFGFMNNSGSWHIVLEENGQEYFLQDVEVGPSKARVWTAKKGNGFRFYNEHDARSCWEEFISPIGKVVGSG